MSFGNLETVSYTHLDVYKRQAMLMFLAAIPFTVRLHCLRFRCYRP